MPEKKKELTVETYPCSCGQVIRFFDLDDHEPLSDANKSRLEAAHVILAKKGQVIKCPNPKCKNQITVT